MSTIVGVDTPPDTNARALKKLREQAIQSHSEMRAVRQWDRMKRMYLGQFWYDDKGNKIQFPSWKAKAGNPALWEIVNHFVPILIARRPKFVPSARGSENEMLAKMLASGIDYEWERQTMKRSITLAAKQALIFGNAFLYTGVHPGLRSDDLYTRVLTPYEVFPDPAATSMADMAYCWFKFSVTKRQLASILGPNAKKILAELKGSSSRSTDDSKFRATPSGNNEPMLGTLQASRTATAFDTEVIGPQSQRYGAEQHYALWECYLPEASDSEQVHVIDDEEIVLPVHGKGRRTFLIEDQYFEEMDTENPFKHGQIPLSVIGVDEFSSEFWAQSYLLPGADRAEQIADMDNQFSNHIRLTMNPGWTIPAQAGIPPGTVYSYPGMQLLYNHPYEPKQFDAPEIPSGAFAHRATLKHELDDAYGTGGIARGNIEGGITHTSGQTVQALQGPGDARMTTVLGSLEDGIGRWGYQTMCNTAQFWPEEKWRRVLPDDLQVIPSIDPMTGQETQELVPLPWDDPQFFGADYDGFMPDIKMETGSSLPEDKNQKMSTSFNLNDRGAFGFQGGAVAARELLTAAEWPGKEEIIQHVAMEQEAAMQAGAQQATPDSGGGQNKALGGQRSPASEQSVRAGGQEVRG